MGQKKMLHTKLVLDCRNQHGEGIFWNPLDRHVWWTDIEGKALWSFDPDTGKAISHDMPDRVCCFAPRAEGGLIVGMAKSIGYYDLETGQLTGIANFESENPNTRLNDGRTDRRGRLVAGGMNETTGEADSSVVRVDPDKKVTTLIEGVACANSICFSPDGRTLFFSDTPERTIRSYDYDLESGELGAMQILVDMACEPGVPDGSCVDAEGGVWNAAWEGRRVVRVSPEGQIDLVIDVPTWKPTCCAFGGEDLDTLFITSSRLMSSKQNLSDDPHAGGLFAVKPGVCGIADAAFAG